MVDCGVSLCLWLCIVCIVVVAQKDVSLLSHKTHYEVNIYVCHATAVCSNQRRQRRHDMPGKFTRCNIFPVCAVLFLSLSCIAYICMCLFCVRMYAMCNVQGCANSDDCTATCCFYVCVCVKIDCYRDLCCAEQCCWRRLLTKCSRCEVAPLRVQCNTTHIARCFHTVLCLCVWTTHQYWVNIYSERCVRLSVKWVQYVNASTCINLCLCAVSVTTYY